jgi:epoxyqueuosine reductase
MDATKCISYLTIEHRGEIAEDLQPGMGRQVFGCDICQDVCPWNRRAPLGWADADLAAREELVNPDLEWLAGLEEADFERLFNGSPVRRAGFWGIRRNIAIAMGNSGLSRFLPRLERWAKADLEKMVIPDGAGTPGGEKTGSIELSKEAGNREALRKAAQWAIRRVNRAK